jgi:hypothetical protein
VSLCHDATLTQQDLNCPMVIPFSISPLLILLTTHHFPSQLTVHCLHTVGMFCHLSSQHPSRATWMRHLGCLGRMCLLPPLSDLPDVLIINLQPFKFQAVLTFSARYPSQATLACCLVTWVGTLMDSGFLLPGGTRDPSLLCPGFCEGLHIASVLALWISLYRSK